jgi:hypothetical protein
MGQDKWTVAGAQALTGEEVWKDREKLGDM